MYNDNITTTLTQVHVFSLAIIIMNRLTIINTVLGFIVLGTEQKYFESH